MVLFDNKYEFVKELGRGGFGKVFMARDVVAKRLVAIKQLNSTDIASQRNIIYEIQMVAKFNHSHIVTYYHHFWKDGLLFLVMEYCAGGCLQDKLNIAMPLSASSLIWTTIISDTMQYIHEKGIVHHDIKPENILFTENGTIKISDFGIANTGGGTRAFMSPESLVREYNSITDPRVDVYALGVTLMILLTGRNPFYFLPPEEIIAIHDRGEFPIRNLPNWQQEIILKAINKVPELRFQSMKDFSDSIMAHQVPLVLDKINIKAGVLGQKIEKLLSSKKWLKAGVYLEYGLQHFPDNVSILRVCGKYNLMQEKTDIAKKLYEKALKLNPRLDIQKELGWINLVSKNYPVAISLLSDHIHRNPSDFEAYNLLLQCFYESNRYEAGMNLARTLLDIDITNACFANNYYICCVMQDIRKIIFPNTVLKVKSNDFLDYNYSVVLESKSTHDFEKKPTLKSKLLFMDYRFHKMLPGSLFLTETNKSDLELGTTQKMIITFGREGYDMNDIELPGGTAISRRHCLIINSKDDVWLYDLSSTGTFVNDEKVSLKKQLIGLNTISIDKVEYKITPDQSKLL